MNYFLENIAIITRRWPIFASMLKRVVIDSSQVEYLSGASNTLVYKNIQLSSNYNAKSEAEIQCDHITAADKIVYLYGVGMGVVQQHLLAEPKLQKLNVIPLSIELFAVSLTYVDHQFWLQNPKVNLQLSALQSDVKFPFIALPADLVLAEDDSALIRDLLCLALDSDFIAESNNAQNMNIAKRIEKNMALLHADADVLSIPTYLKQNIKQNTILSVNYVITAAGPTLEYHYAWLKKQRMHNEILLIALDATVKPLLQQGIVPDIVISIDAIASDLFQGVDIAVLKNTALVYFPLLDNAFLQQWPGKRFASFSQGSSFNELANQITKTRLYSAGSVIHPAADLACQLGAKKVLLLGADFSLVNAKTHAENINILQERKLLSANETPHWLLNGKGKKVPTYLNFRGYLRDLEYFIQQQIDVDFYTGSLDGAYIKDAPLWPDFMT